MKKYIVLTVSIISPSTLISKSSFESFADEQEARKYYDEKRVDGSTISCGLYTLTE